MRNVAGNIVTGDDFFDRENERTRLWRALETDNLLLLAPRRVGKSSLMKKMASESGDHNFRTAYVDVSDCRDELELVRHICQTILAGPDGKDFFDKCGDRLSRFAGRLQKLGVGVASVELRAEETTWDRLGEELADALEQPDSHWLIQIDELPVFVLTLYGRGTPEARDRVKHFLYWLRRIRLAHPTTRWMIAGSIGLDTVATRLSVADAINDLSLVTIGAFGQDVADSFLKKLSVGERVELSPEARARMLKRVGWLVPYYLQLLFQSIRHLGRRVEVADIDEAVDALSGPGHKNAFDWWRQRLLDELGEPDAGYAIQVLNHCCRRPEGVGRGTVSLALENALPDTTARETRLRYVLDVLENDGYLVEEAGKLQFRSPLLREFWLKRIAPPKDQDV